jgi:hypothetical protein
MRKTRQRVLVTAFWFLLVLLTGCRSEEDTEKAKFRFGLGTNAVVHIQHELSSSGYYLFLLKLPGIDRSKFAAEKWPLELPAKFHLLFKTNEHIILDSNVLTLRFDYINDEKRELVYHVGGLSLLKGAKVDCLIEDLGTEPKRPAEFIFLRAKPK